MATDEHKQNAKIKSSATTQLVSEIVLSDGRTISYEYDEEERITKVTDSVDGVTEYTYDALGQLVTEAVNDTVVNQMTYDNYGNIRTKNDIEYTYDGDWKDKLISYNGQSITYDAQGNPISYLGHTLTWEKGRQLKSFVKTDGTVIEYTYNANGIRTSKTVNGVLHTYTLDGTKILRETWGDNTLVPLYDNEDSVCGIIYNQAPYYFLKNLQGDIIAIVDKDAQTVAKYSYDAWGVCTVTQDTSGCNIAHINPFRYRGYFFDEGTGLYYLQSRYYNAEVGRFVNGDSAEFAVMQQSAIEHNLFAYCGNDCANERDTTGKALIKFLALGIQLSLSIGRLNLGFEFLWDLKNGAFYPFMFTGGSESKSLANGTNYVTKYLLNPLKNIKKSPSAMINALKKLSVSVSAVVVFGNSKQKMPKDYQGWFNSLSFVVKVWFLNIAISGAFARNSKGYIASLGLGLSSSRSISFGKTYYIQLNANLKKQLNKLFEPLKSKANSVKNKIQTAAKILF